MHRTGENRYEKSGRIEKTKRTAVSVSTPFSDGRLGQDEETRVLLRKRMIEIMLVNFKLE